MLRVKCPAVGSRLLYGALVLLILALVSPVAALYAAPQAQIPVTINYQGTLRDAQGALVNGTRDMTFRVYDAVLAGNMLHEERIDGVSVRAGVFNVVLGDGAALSPGIFADGPRFIGVTVDPDDPNANEMIPRQRLHPVPWAQQATIAQTATTLVPNAAVSGGLTVNDRLTVKNAPLYLNINDSYVWNIRPDANGQLGFVELNSGLQKLGIAPNGNVTAAGSVTAAGDVTAAGRIVAVGGFEGHCVTGGFNPGVVGNNLNVTCNSDVAETFGTDERTEPGDLVVFIPEDRTFPAVQRSSQSYESAIVGVVSTDPGLVFDQGETRLSGDNTNLITDDKTVVAMVGRVPTKFSLENGPIAVGDPLTSSSTPGAAMKATQAGQIIGYAMQSSDAATDGKLLVWLQLSMYIPGETLAAINGSAHAGDANSTATIADLETQIAALTKQIETIEATNSSARWPWSLPLLGGLVVVGAVFGSRNRFLGGL